MKRAFASPPALLSVALVLAGCAGGSSPPSTGGARPTAAFSFSPAAPSAGETVSFTDGTTGAPTSWSWDFGDGATSTARSPSHAYAAAGAYVVTLVATNTAGARSATHAIQVSPESGGALTYPIVDTRQATFYGAGAVVLGSAPSAPGDAYFGQDAQFAGLQPAYQDNGDGTVTDLGTGLTWVSARGSKLTWDEAVAGAAACRVGGHADWRMPTLKELYSLIDFNGKSGATDAACVPYLDTRYFEITFGDATGGRVIDGQDWSATAYVSTTMHADATVFGVNFIDGRIKGYPKYEPGSNGTVPHTLYVRYVRGNPAYGVNDFVDGGDGTVTDRATGLMWAQADSGVGMDWASALAWVQARNASSYLGHADWRLPDAKELQSLVDYTRSPATTGSAAIAPVFICTPILNEGGAADYPYYWASTTHLDSAGAVYLAFGRALGWMQQPGASTYTLLDVHGAGAQRSDPKSGSVTSYYLGTDAGGHPAYGRGPQGDVIRIDNFVRLVRDAR